MAAAQPVANPLNVTVRTLVDAPTSVGAHTWQMEVTAYASGIGTETILVAALLRPGESPCLYPHASGRPEALPRMRNRI